jgi:hypothetical protein
MSGEGTNEPPGAGVAPGTEGATGTNGTEGTEGEGTTGVVGVISGFFSSLMDSERGASYTFPAQSSI